jgi:hypothetical protein
MLSPARHCQSTQGIVDEGFDIKMIFVCSWAREVNN